MDNTQVNPMTGGDVIATADTTSINGSPTSGVKVERVKVGYGTGPTHTDVDPSAPLPVSDQDTIMLLAQLLAKLGVNDGAGRTMVNVNNIPAVTQSGTWTVQPGNTANTTAWLMTLAAVSTSLYGPVGFALDQHYQSLQAFDSVRTKITVT